MKSQVEVPQERDAIADVVIVGSGAGALSSAIFAVDQGLSVLVIEKSDKYGGTSAISGGGIWIPNNDQFKKKGGNDSFEKAMVYLNASTRGKVEESKLQAYLESAPRMVRYLEQNSRVRYAVAEKYPDYYPELPGALPGGRTLDPELYDTSALGDELSNLREASPTTLLMGKIAWTARDAHKAVSKESGWRLMILWKMLRYQLDFRWRKKHETKRDRRAALGSALIASLRHSMLDRDIPLWLNTDFEDFIVEDGRVSGVMVKHDGKPLRISARKGVIMGAGGFEQSQQLREQYLPKPTSVEWSATPEGQNTGAGLIAGQKLGAATDLLDWAWWTPTMQVPREKKARPLFVERAFPGAIMVNGEGQRFVNESEPYLECGDAIYRDNQKTEGQSLPAWVIFDGHFRFNYAMGPLMPAQIMPDSRLPKAWRQSLYWKADSLDQLAEAIGVNPKGLNTTVDRFNQFAEDGEDKDFQRGANVFDRYYGDRNVKPNPCLAPLRKGPFYAMRVEPGDIGTKGGLVTNEHGQVVREDGSVIGGLYAIGNTAASVMGTSYPGAGSTIGPAMTFGYIAAHHIAAVKPKGIREPRVEEEAVA
ncbi:FAD-dependent oxidoreductase [uncultured Endozoicomonas sp.]|uniref:FAD-dependent oxidoreductase n=1 Tax=uncultured Endozoicomonas sp. TaxID=432652 RepID=UPI00263188CA|nr:FAD-dependent oxidoreductase [uncultured Endozoicomonas sp.]